MVLLLRFVWACFFASMAAELSPCTPWKSANKCSAARRAWGLAEVADVARKFDCLLSAIRIRPPRHSGSDPKPPPNPISFPLGFEADGKTPLLRVWGGEWKMGLGGRVGSLPELRCEQIRMANKTQSRSIVASLPKAAVDVLESGTFKGTSLLVVKDKNPDRADLKQNKAWIMGILPHFPTKACNRRSLYFGSCFVYPPWCEQRMAIIGLLMNIYNCKHRAVRKSCGVNTTRPADRTVLANKCSGVRL
jgi:hypothetical protein